MPEPLSPLVVMLMQHTIAYAVLISACVWYIYPWLKQKPEHAAVSIALIPFLFRYVGNSSMVSGVVGPGYPLAAQWIVLIGDSLSAVLALLALGLYRYRSRWARAAAWAVVIESAGYSAFFGLTTDIETLVNNMHAHWYVGAMFVPILLTATVMLAMLLLSAKRKGE